MNSFNFYLTFAVALIASGQVYASYGQGGYGSNNGGASVSDASYGASSGASAGDYQLQGSSGDASSSSAAAAANGGDAASYSNAAPSSYGSNQNIPYSPGNTRGNTITSSITYPQNKGEILIHRPAPIIVKRPPTKVLVNHPPLVVKPAPVVLHKPPAVVVRKVYVKHHPRPVKVEPVYVNVVKPPAEKYFVKDQQYQNGAQLSPVPAGYAPLNSAAGQAAVNNAAPSFSAANADGAAAQAGYQLVQGSQGLNIYSGSLQNSYGQSAGQYAGQGY